VREPDPKLTIHRAEAAEAYRRVYLGGWLGKWRGVTQPYSALREAKERQSDSAALIKHSYIHLDMNMCTKK